MWSNISLKLLLAISFLLCVACSASAPGHQDEQPGGLITIAHLKTLARDVSTPILHDVAIEGYVVANDLYGEYYKSIILCDDSGGIEISVDLDDTARQFPISAHVTVQCNSLALGDYGGMLVLGAQPSGEYLVDRISEQDVGRYFTVDTTTPRQVEPTTATLAELSPRHINNFVLVENVTFGELAGQTWCEKDAETGEFMTTERVLSERGGVSMNVRILGSCDYASERIPSGYGAVAAMVEYFGDNYVLRVINRNILF